MIRVHHWTADEHEDNAAVGAREQIQAWLDGLSEEDREDLGTLLGARNRHAVYTWVETHTGRREWAGRLYWSSSKQHGETS